VGGYFWRRLAALAVGGAGAFAVRLILDGVGAPLWLAIASVLLFCFGFAATVHYCRPFGPDERASGG
jgi:hypothetical protein